MASTSRWETALNFFTAICESPTKWPRVCMMQGFFVRTYCLKILYRYEHRVCQPIYSPLFAINHSTPVIACVMKYLSLEYFLNHTQVHLSIISVTKIKWTQWAWRRKFPRSLQLEVRLLSDFTQSPKLHLCLWNVNKINNFQFCRKWPSPSPDNYSTFKFRTKQTNNLKYRGTTDTQLCWI